MQIIEATAMGLCFGVRDALLAARQIERPTHVTIFGQLVHNPHITSDLQTRGFTTLDESHRLPQNVATPAVLITAHGISNRERAQLLAAGKILHDTTCPLVKKAHTAALDLAHANYFLLVAGKRRHVEVAGLTGDLDPTRHAVIEHIDEVQHYPTPKIAIIAQTTSIEREVRAMVARVQFLNPPPQEVRFVNTICQPTRDRQSALESLAQKITILVVVGGPNSHNTHQLAARGRELGLRVLHIQSANQLSPDLFLPTDIIGLTAGTSTPQGTITTIKHRLESF